MEWLTGFDDKKIKELIDRRITFETFFTEAKLNQKAGNNWGNLRLSN
ncbi:DUF2200 domain-containing protein [Sphingobacterium alkalisoli]|nr:DUF2200 domain-containing protein [Sphingobacterium alkalisoli]